MSSSQTPHLDIAGMVGHIYAGNSCAPQQDSKFIFFYNENFKYTSERRNSYFSSETKKKM